MIKSFCSVLVIESPETVPCEGSLKAGCPGSVFIPIKRPLHRAAVFMAGETRFSFVFKEGRIWNPDTVTAAPANNNNEHTLAAMTVKISGQLKVLTPSVARAEPKARVFCAIYC